MPLPRKTIRHYDEAHHAHSLTFSCYQRRPILDDHDRRVIFSRAVDAAVLRLGFRLVAFVYMPEHVHMLVWSAELGTKVSDLLFALKRPSSYRIKQLLKTQDPALLAQLTIPDGPDGTVFRFWQQGPGFDGNRTDLEELHATAEYDHNNPVRRGLCENPGDYKWSSWRHYHRPDLAPDPDLPEIHGYPPL